MVGDRGAEAAQADLHLFVVQRPAVCADLVQGFPQRGRVGDGVGREARQAVADEGVQFGVGDVRQQHLAQRRRMGRCPLADECVHADQSRAVHGLHADRLAVVEDADMDGFAGFARQVLEWGKCLPAKLLMPNRGGPEGVEAHRQRIAACERIFLKVSELLDRVEDAEHGRLGLPQFGGEFGQAPGFLTGETIHDFEALAEGAEAVRVACHGFGVSHYEIMAFIL